MALTPIYTRSPKIVTQSGVAADEIKAEVFIWNSPDSIPTNPTYTLSKPIPSTNILECSFDISPYCKEYITFSNFGEVSAEQVVPNSEYCYCTVKLYKNDILQSTTEFICFDGYGYFMDGGNVLPDDVLLTEGTYYVKENDNGGAVAIHDDQTLTWSATYTGLVTGGTTSIASLANEMGKIPYVHTSYIAEGNKLEIFQNAVLQKTFYFRPQCEPKYTPVEVDFVNRFGAWQRIIFFKAKKESFSRRMTEFNLMPATLPYSENTNRKQQFNINGNKSIKCNTGWVVEEYSEVIKELMLSEHIQVDYVPCNIVTNGVDLQTHLNDKLINYEIEFTPSHDELNYIV